MAYVVCEVPGARRVKLALEDSNGKPVHIDIRVDGETGRARLTRRQAEILVKAYPETYRAAEDASDVASWAAADDS